MAGERRSINPTEDKDTKLSADCFRWRNNWLRVLFSHFFVRNSIDELISSLELRKLVFISFNYDRLLEYFLVRSVVNLYGLKGIKVTIIWNGPKILMQRFLILFPIGLVYRS